MAKAYPLLARPGQVNFRGVGIHSQRIEAKVRALFQGRGMILEGSERNPQIRGQEDNEADGILP